MLLCVIIVHTRSIASTVVYVSSGNDIMEIIKSKGGDSIIHKSITMLKSSSFVPLLLYIQLGEMYFHFGFSNSWLLQQKNIKEKGNVSKITTNIFQYITIYYDTNISSNMHRSTSWIKKRRLTIKYNQKHWFSANTFSLLFSSLIVSSSY